MPVKPKQTIETVDNMPSYPYKTTLPFQQRFPLKYMSRTDSFAIQLKGADEIVDPGGHRRFTTPVRIEFVKNQYVLDKDDSLYVEKRNKLEDPRHFSLLPGNGTMVFPYPGDKTWIEAGFFKQGKVQQSMIPVNQPLEDIDEKSEAKLAEYKRNQGLVVDAATFGE